MIRRLRALLGRFIAFVQRVVVTLCLFFVYFLGMGITALLVRVFNRSLLRQSPADADSWWVEAEGYQPDPDTAARQS